jgi:hypothetical protein
LEIGQSFANPRSKRCSAERPLIKVGGDTLV